MEKVVYYPYDSCQSYLVRSGNIGPGSPQNDECQKRQPVERPDKETGELNEGHDVSGQNEEQGQHTLDTETHEDTTRLVDQIGPGHQEALKSAIVTRAVMTVPLTMLGSCCQCQDPCCDASKI